MSDVFDALFSEKPRWREQYEYKMYELQKRTGLTKDQLKKVADAMEEFHIIRL